MRVSVTELCKTELPKTGIHSITAKRRRPMDKAAYFLIYLVSAGVGLMVLFFAGYIFYKGIPKLSLAFLTTAPNPIQHTIGILPSIINTVYIILLSLLFSVPLGIGGAIYLGEYAKHKQITRMIEFTIETLSGIPSVIFGVVGYLCFCTLLDLKVSLLSGALTLTIIVLPTIVRTTGEALRAVPASYREAAMGMGATKWYMIRTVLLPSASRGILTAIILAAGRMIGESAALLLVAGGSAMYMPRGNLGQQIMSSGSTLAVELYRYAYSRGDNETGFAIAAVLLVIAILLNLSVKAINKKLGGEYK